jgi:hypothetical protein
MDNSYNLCRIFIARRKESSFVHLPSLVANPVVDYILREIEVKYLI